MELSFIEPALTTRDAADFLVDGAFIIKISNPV